MIVMKFGGSSLASAASIRRVVSIIRSEAARHPVVVTSAMGDTTDVLLEVLSDARRANSYSAWKLQEAIKDQHFSVSEELLHGSQQSEIDQYFRETFRDLHIRMLELSEGERPFTPELQDWTISLGEQLSSRLLAAILQEHCGNTLHLDSRKLILTNSRFTNAQPCYWETYARIRWSVPVAGRNKLVVLGGFIGGTEDGRTTTLGRGGSDLTASIVGAAINADEIQVWKDVDGMLTCDPRIHQGAHKVRRLSYEEAGELAKAGATILHPETIAPAKRLRIPIVIRNTFNPSGEGTRIEGATGGSPAPVESVGIKSIAIKSGITLLEVYSADVAQDFKALSAFCEEHSAAAIMLCCSARTAYIAVNENSKIPEESLVANGCLEVKIRSSQAILTLVGQGVDRQAVAKRLNFILQGLSAFIIPNEESACSVRVAVAQHQLNKCIDLIHSTFFGVPDAHSLITQDADAAVQNPILEMPPSRNRPKPKAFVFSPSFVQPN